MAKTAKCHDVRCTAAIGCYAEVTQALASRPVACMPIDSDRYGRIVACDAYNAHFAGASICVRSQSLYRPSPSIIGGVHERVCDGRLVDEATLRFALAGVDDLHEEIRAARFVRAAA